MSSFDRASSSSAQLRERLAKYSAAKGKSLFRSPHAGGDGAIFDGTTKALPVQFGKEVALLNTCEGVCLGKVGETKVCMELAHVCTVKKHMEVKVSITDPLPAFFIRANKQMVYQSPCLEVGTMTQSWKDSLHCLQETQSVARILS